MGEWGSVAMHLRLCRVYRGGVEIVVSAKGPGIVTCGDPETAFLEAVSPWLSEHGSVPSLLAGMIGSPLGWVECPYADCPADAQSLRSQLTQFSVAGTPVAIAPGLRCRNIFGLPDMMRGEELALFGWLASARPADGEWRISCLTGRHPKWVLSCGMQVHSFFTSMQGELHQLLVEYSLLGKAMASGDGSATAAGRAQFDRGVATMCDQPGLSLGHALFSARSLLVAGELPANLASSYLSGLVVGADVRDALTALSGHPGLDLPVTLIGTPSECDLAAAVFQKLGRSVAQANGHDSSLRGFVMLDPFQTELAA
ncbi:2-dehydro-3-deoxygalactonokinase [Sphingomonas sp. 37zxx]|uniref:2-dehydro-3-deoxygalactonokinase n=1 Tax=Sphingomonas sp. 37zxx TaxID=1550073 RepID=UPI0022B14261|nr:2-dehydro-3-deoxygalactonokinase [Sphingomonas sp. 37zxx]